MDGSPSASEPDREYFEPARDSDADRELNDLRVRAHGPYPDIEADPAALTRLIDLEAAHVAASAPDRRAQRGVAAATGASPAYTTADGGIAGGTALQEARLMNNMRSAFPSQNAARLLGQPDTAAWSRGWFIATSTVVVVVVTILLSLTWHFGPRPDATLHLSEGETNSDLLDVLEYQGRSTDVTTLRQFQPFHDVDVWSIENGEGYVCLVAWDRGSGRFETQCVPPGTELAIYATVPAEATGGFGERLPEGSFVSLHLRDNTVDVYVDLPQTTD